MRKASKLALIATFIATVSQPTYAFFDFGKLFGFGDKEEKTQEQVQEQTSTNSVEELTKQLLGSQGSNLMGLTSILSNPLIQNIQNTVEVSGTQAASGTAALLSLAASQLTSSDSSELTKLIPQLEQITNLIPTDLSAQLKNISDVQNVFNGLGLDSSTLTQFVPIIINTVTQSGASSNLVNQLNSLWKTA